MSNSALFNIRDFGAEISDLLQTKAIQSAIDAASENGGEVVVPEGCWRTGGLVLKSGVTLRLEDGAEIEASRDERDYPGANRWYRGIIRADDAHDIAIIGSRYSRINGMNCFDERGEENFRGPHGILFMNCRNVRLSGYTMKDTGNWAHALFHCEHVVAEGVKVFGGHDSFDFHDSEDVCISNCEFHSGDDCVAGFANRNCIVRDCIFDTSCQAVRIGGADLLFERCRMPVKTSYGHRLGLSKEDKQRSVTRGENARHGPITAVIYYCDTRWKIDRPQKNIVFRDCDFQNCNQAFAYNFDGRDMWCCIHPLESISFEHCSFTGLKKTSAIYSDAEKPIDISFRECRFAASDGFGNQEILSAYQFKRLNFENCLFEGFGKPHIITRSKGEVSLTGATVLENVFRPDPNDKVFTFAESAEEIAKLPADEQSWRDWAATVKIPDEKLWDNGKGFYVTEDNPLVADVPASVLAVLRGKTEHADVIGHSCFRYFRYLVGFNLTGQVVMPGGNMSTLPAGAFAFALNKANPLFARAFVTDFLRRENLDPASVAGMKIALEALNASSL